MHEMSGFPALSFALMALGFCNQLSVFLHVLFQNSLTQDPLPRWL